MATIFIEDAVGKVCMYKREKQVYKANEGTDSKKVPLG